MTDLSAARFELESTAALAGLSSLIEAIRCDLIDDKSKAPELVRLAHKAWDRLDAVRNDLIAELGPLVERLADRRAQETRLEDAA